MNHRHPSQSGIAAAALPGKLAPAGGPPSPPTPEQAAQVSSQRATLLAVLVVILAILAAYNNSFTVSLVFDDYPGITTNQSIRHLWPIWDVLSPPISGVTVSGRPLLNLSLAIDYAISGDEVWSYHATNLVIHILAALLLFDLVRRTFLLPTMRDRWSASAIPLAFVIALLWAVHPLQTESVTYVVQRAESLMGLFYLLALYCFVRGESTGWDGSCTAIPRSLQRVGSTTAAPTREAVSWYAASALACLFGMASKEVMISAPLVVLLYDRTFCAGSFREAWRRRYAFYLALASTWLLLGWLVLTAGNLGRSAGFAPDRFSWRSYSATEPGVIAHYLRLAVWPSGLCLDYGWPAARTWGDVLVPGIPIALVLALTVWALVKRPAWGLLGASFFAILAPTSSFFPVLDAAFDHRMYLPLAAVVTALVTGTFLIGRWIARRAKIPLLVSQSIGGGLVLLAGVTLIALTVRRNMDYQDDLSLWADTVAKAPHNPRAHTSMGLAGRS